MADVYSQNDRSIKVWNLELVSQTQSLDSHSSWIRALATEKDVLTSASKDNTVKVRIQLLLSACPRGRQYTDWE